MKGKQFAWVVLTAAVAAAANVLLGWEFVLAAAVLGGFMAPGQGWMVGLWGVVLGSGVLILVNLALAPDSTLEMMRVVSALLGGLPPFVTPVLTILAAAVTGAVGGGLGQTLRNISRPVRR